MAKYEVGYAKPPKHSRFKAGASGNPQGRPKHKASTIGEAIHDVLTSPAEYFEGGRPKRTTQQELSIRALARDALNGDVQAAQMLLKLRAHAQSSSDVGNEIVHLHNWLPDHPGQTAEQKTGEQMKQADADTLEWWKSPAAAPKRETR
jgi:Family of unknown function (DUF5681)